MRDDLESADFRVPAVRGLLGAEADEARLRGVFAPARRAVERATRGRSPLAALVRLFLLGDQLSPREVGAALPRLGPRGAETLGLVGGSPGGALEAALSLNPVEISDAREARERHWWILSDLDDQLRRGPARPDHVMGVGGATRSLIAQLPPDHAGAALDLGTGCGIVALHLSLRGPVVATDLSERALVFARANARLNRAGTGAGIDFRSGDLFGPVAGERFALIASNPPFVITPRTGSDGRRYEYRDGGMVGDRLVQEVVRRGYEHLAEGGTLLCLANWESHWGDDGLGRVEGWVEALGDRTAAWVIERERLSPERYAETWARDGGARPGAEDFERLMRSWLDDFASRRVVAVGLGSIRIRRLARTDSTGSERYPERAGGAPVRLERAGGALSGRAGGPLSAIFDAAIEVSAMSDAEMLERRWLLSDGVGELREHVPGQEQPSRITFSAEVGLARRLEADTLLAAALGACDGELSMREISGALAEILGIDEDDLRRALLADFRDAVWLGLLTPAPPSGTHDTRLEP
nr:methyltransferase [Leucobacter weissii]